MRSRVAGIVLAWGGGWAGHSLAPLEQYLSLAEDHKLIPAQLGEDVKQFLYLTGRLFSGGGTGGYDEEDARMLATHIFSELEHARAKQLGYGENVYAFTELKEELRNHGLSSYYHIGHIACDECRQEAINTLWGGYPNQVLGIYLNGRVGALLFNPFNRATVEFVSGIKHVGGRDRQYAYGLACTADVVDQLVDNDRLLRKPPYQKLYSKSLTVLPAITSAIDMYGIPPEFCTKTDEGPQLMVFVPEPGSMLEEILIGGSRELPLRLLGMTSSSISGSNAFTKRLEAAVFCIGNEIRWLDNDPDPVRRGPYTIVGFEYGYLKCLREGNVPFRELALLMDTPG